MKKIIEQEVIRLVKTHNTNSSFEIVDAENILVLQELLGSINGYYVQILPF
ncbi:hypothetical protein ACJDU8_21740 [Clostridium sp. WILCCON 0269]|uniref:Uncharacterized protein n=1 Tax=Candidatus Clostridium eludens TaxID=3381663 RepID=A0ABW8SUS9_9CLOT